MKQAETIMVVEDDPDLRADLAELFRDEGYDVVTAREGGEALRWMQSALRPGLIVLDLLMTPMTGWEFRSRQLEDPVLASVPVIILSGVSDVPRHAARLDVSDYFGKPIEVDRLLQTVQRHCPDRSTERTT
jgi:CheY-like chemotaxis protein